MPVLPRRAYLVRQLWCEHAESGGSADTSFTGKPAPGRPPGGRPSTAPLGRRPPRGPAPPAPNPAGAAAAAPSRAASGAAAGEAGAAAVVAPEVAVGAAVAAETSRRLQRDRTNRNDDRSAQARSQETRPRPVPVGDSSASPVSGRDGHKKGPSRARPQRWLTDKEYAEWVRRRASWEKARATTPDVPWIDPFPANPNENGAVQGR